jgi:aerotaxis receptor
MRDNGPVTGRETPFPDGQVLVSRTDARGVITFANQAFVQISGFTLDELMGKAHNLVRHPEMPPAAFADLWTTIQAGHAWVGLVKNRSKSGDHYWVRANVTPIVENGQVTGHISIRVKPTREEVALAEQVYTDLLGGRGGWSVSRGCIRRVGALPALQRALAPLSRRITLAALSMVVLTSLGVAISLDGAALQERWGFNPAVLTWVCLGLSTILGLLLAWRIPRSLRRNLDDVTDHLDQLARDEINTMVDTGRADEFGTVNLALSALQTRMTYVRLSEKETRNRTLCDFDRTIGTVLSHVAEAVNELMGTAERQTTVASAVAGSAQSVSAAATEMSASIKEISGQTSQVSDLARSAADSAKQSHEVMAKLAAAASEITDVARLIGRIADQTNLLSLNASIEAASAGEAGRGFAVVANEVKGLSARTREATGSIGAKISTIQADTQAAVQALEALAAQIARLSENAQAIAAAVEEQTSVTGEIAENADRTNSAAGETGQAASQVGEASAALAQITTRLEEAVRLFKARV